jgi:hypothetical protein
MPSGRLRLAILAATVAAFLLVPVAAQAATGVETLKININGSGAGQVRTLPGIPVYNGSPPMACTYASPGPQAGICEDLMSDEGEGWEQVYVEARAVPGSEFVGWTETKGSFENCNKANHELGVCAPYVEPPGEFEETTELTATFNAEVGEVLTLNIEEGAGFGVVVSNPAGIEECGPDPQTCGKAYAANTIVTLTASPLETELFKGWKKCDAKVEYEPGKFTGVNGRQCTVKMSQAKTVGASFIPGYKLTASKAGSGKGTISTSPSGISCGETCPSSAATYKEGALTVKEKPAKHFHFVEFKEGTNSATVCNGVKTETCAIASFAANSTLKAQFAEDTKRTLSYSVNGASGGQGSVKTKPAGIVCGYTCTAASAEFYENEGEVEVTVTLNKGTTSVQWTTAAGTCTGKVEAPVVTCKVPMTANKSLIAKFQ